jgi:hypothetical protein
MTNKFLSITFFGWTSTAIIIGFIIVECKERNEFVVGGYNVGNRPLRNGSPAIVPSR